MITNVHIQSNEWCFTRIPDAEKDLACHNEVKQEFSDRSLTVFVQEILKYLKYAN